jgi:NADPH:quinone reductase
VLKEEKVSTATAKKMKGVAIDRFGGLETLSVKSLPVPQIEDHEILIHVESAGVGAWDPFEREGGFAKLLGIKPKFPYVLGSEGAGMVAAVGRQVAQFGKGDRVYACSLANPKGGFYAEYATAKADNAAHVPDKVSTQQAGVLMVDAVTALCGLDKTLGLKEGESVMIIGASGGIGHLAVQFAKRMGARVFAVASGQDGVALAKKIGADAVADGHKDDVAAAVREISPGTA